jgi:hypothetical protein
MNLIFKLNYKKEGVRGNLGSPYILSIIKRIKKVKKIEMLFSKK